MFKKYSKLNFSLVVLAVILGSIPLGVGAVPTAKSLDIGSQGAVVQTLQVVLNLDPATKVSLVGAGAPGQETEYFGEKTRAAVIKFQKKYHITGENGQIGPQTLKLINYLGPKMILAKRKKIALVPTDWPESGVVTTVRTPIKSYSSKAATAPKATSPVIKKVIPKLSSISPQTVGNGGTITLRGEGFTKTGNTVATKFEAITNVPSTDGQTISFRFSIPLSSKVLSGINSLPYEALPSLTVPISVYVTNINGKSGELTFNYQLR
jgi:peptidoglycan hydrolase-like protein with peptidoglycan-binding domain